MALQPGTQAPDFTLKHKHAEGLDDITLSANYGSKKTLLLFFPFAYTSVCQDELCTVSQGLSGYGGDDAEVYGISVDSPFAQEAFAEKFGITVKLLSDFNKDVAKAYDVLDENFVPGVLDFKGVAKRSAFVISKDGQITYAWSSDNPKDLPPFDEVKAALSA